MHYLCSVKYIHSPDTRMVGYAAFNGGIVSSNLTGGTIKYFYE